MSSVSARPTSAPSGVVTTISTPGTGSRVVSPRRPSGPAPAPRRRGPRTSQPARSTAPPSRRHDGRDGRHRHRQEREESPGVHRALRPPRPCGARGYKTRRGNAPALVTRTRAPVRRSARRAASARLVDSTSHTVIDHSAVAPATWTPTSSAGHVVEVLDVADRRPAARRRTATTRSSAEDAPLVGPSLHADGEHDGEGDGHHHGDAVDAGGGGDVRRRSAGRPRRRRAGRRR